MREREHIFCIACGKRYQEDNGWPLHTCPECRIKNKGRQDIVVKHALARPADAWVQKDLTTEEWVTTLLHFHAMCAYCQIRSYECLEHFIPLKLGGSTSISNCVPSCLRCNRLKNNLHPALVTKIPREDIDRVRSYLQQFS